MKTKQFKQMLKKLEEKFELIEDVSNHYIYDIRFNNRVVRWVTRSHSLKDKHDQLIADNLDLNVHQLRNFISCDLSTEEYKNLLVQKGYIK